MRIIIIGGGFIGQLLHTLVPYARVMDWRPARPETPPRLLGPQYLWEPIPGLPCKKFNVVTHIDGRKANEETIRRYKKKVGKEQDGGDWRAQFRENMDGYSVQLPEDRVEYNRRIVSVDSIRQILNLADGRKDPYDILISTIPLPAMAALCGVRRVEPPFESRPIYLWTRPVGDPEMESFYVNYVSTPSTDIYRETLRNGAMHFESLTPYRSSEGVRSFKLAPGKIYPNVMAEAVRESLREMNIFTFGRYASWNPDELAHETYRQAKEWTAVHA